MIHQEDLSSWRVTCIWQEIPIISNATEKFLWSYLREKQPNHIIEIGGAAWYSTRVLSQIMSIYSPLGTISSREISYPHYHQWCTLPSCEHNSISYLWNFCRYDCSVYLKRWYYDMVFIDGRKSETLLYIQKLIPYLHDTCTIIVDDAIKFKYKMQDCYDWLDNNDISYEEHLLDDDDGILLIPQVWPLLQALCAL